MAVEPPPRPRPLAAVCPVLALALALALALFARPARAQRDAGDTRSGSTDGANGETENGGDNAAPDSTADGGNGGGTAAENPAENPGENADDEEAGDEPEALPEGPLVAVHVEPELPGEDPWARVGLHPGVAFTRAVGRAALSHALASNTFAEARMTAASVEGGVALFVRGERRVRVREVAFSGVAGRPSESVRADFEITHDTWVTDADVTHAAEHLRQTYVDAGWSQAQVTTRWRNTDDPAVRILLVSVTEGPVTRVRRVVLEGVPSDAEASVREALGIGAGSVADPRALRRSTEQVSSEMRRERYLAAVVRPVQFVPADAGRVDAVLSMDAGPRFRIEWIGVSHVPTTALLEALHLEEERALEVTAINAMVMRLRDYYVRRAFLDARVRADVRPDGPGRAVLRFTVREGTQVFVRNVVFPGAEHLGADALQALLEEFLTNELPGGADTVLQDPGDEVEDAIDGGPGFSASNTQRRIELHPERTFVPELYAEATHRMAGRYREIGFLDVSIADPVIRRVEDASRHSALEVTFRVNEGPRTMLEEVVFEGNVTVTTQELADRAGIQLGVPISYAAMDAARTRLVDFYRERGHRFVRVVPYPDRSPNRERARLRFQIDEGPEVHIGRIIVQGNTRTPSWVIVGRMALRSGDLFRPSALRASERQVGELGFFTGVSVTALDPDVAAPVKDLIIQVQELRPQYTEIRGGISTGEGIRAALEYGARNVAGTGVNFVFNGQLGWLGQLLLFGDTLYQPQALFRFRLVGSLLYPVAPLSGPYLRGSFDVTVARALERQFAINSASVGSSVSYRPSRVLAVTATQEVQFAATDLPAGGTIDDILHNTTDPVEYERLRRVLLLPQGSTYIAASRVTGSIDLRDQIFNPTRGVYLSATVEYMHILGFNPSIDEMTGQPLTNKTPGDVLHTLASISGYVPLPFGGIVIASSLRGGVNFHLDQHVDTYPNRLFFMGGTDSIRGWYQDTLIPADQLDPSRMSYRSCQANNMAHPEMQAVPCAELSQRGGDVFFSWRNEIRIPVTTVQGIGVGLAFFVDVGNLWLDSKNFLSPSYPLVRTSFGVGLRGVLPIGPVALDVGFNTSPQLVNPCSIEMQMQHHCFPDPDHPDPTLLESPFAIHFSIGVF